MATVIDCGTGEVRYVEPKRPALAERKAILLDRAAEHRYERETGGVMVGGMLIPTDRQTVGILTAAYIRASEDPNFVIPNWKIQTGVFVSLDADTIKAISTAVTAHVQSCFDRERELTDAILGARTHADLDAVDVTGW